MAKCISKHGLNLKKNKMEKDKNIDLKFKKHLPVNLKILIKLIGCFLNKVKYGQRNFIIVLDFLSH